MARKRGGIRKICVVVQSRANYARIKSVMRAIKKRDDLQLQLIVGASALLDRFGNVSKLLEQDGFQPVAQVYSIVEGETPGTMAKSTGLGIIELATQFETLRPDIILTVADRFETIATAIAGSYMNIPVAHTQGGEVTGSIDENVRHAITKLSHIHFPATERARDYILRMGEESHRVFLTGCPSIDLLTDIDLSFPKDMFESYKGVGPVVDFSKPHLVVLNHPVTTEYGSAFEQTDVLLTALRNLTMPVVWLWPNVDAGSDHVSKRLRMFREQHHDEPFHFFKSFAAEDYARLVNNCSCLVGNSSSAIREGSFLGVPAVNIGSRQRDREHAENVMHAPYEVDAISRAVRAQVAHGRYPRSTMFGDGGAGERIADVLAQVPLTIEKRLSYLPDGAVRQAPKLVKS